MGTGRDRSHRYRLGTHYEALPVDAPRCPVKAVKLDAPGADRLKGTSATDEPEETPSAA